MHARCCMPMCIASEYMPGSAAVRHYTQPAGTQAQHAGKIVSSQTDPGPLVVSSMRTYTAAQWLSGWEWVPCSPVPSSTKQQGPALQLVYVACRRLWASITVRIARGRTDAALTSLGTGASPSSCLHMITAACHNSACVIAWQRQMGQPELQTTVQTSRDSDAAWLVLFACLTKWTVSLS
jgi:hypothetical protein